MENITEINVSFLSVIPPSTKTMFFYLILVISTISIIGNIFALKSVVHRNIKCLQKVCLVSLALNDIFTVVIFSINNLHSLSKELKTWDLGEFMCYFIPMGQALGTTMSSFSLFLIALDRYQSLSSIVGRKWNPGVYKSQLVVFVLWLVSSGISLPMIKMYYYYPIMIIYNDPELEDEQSAMCLSTTKYKLQSYYTTIACVIFFPLVVIFSWLYYKIAVILWKHRIPQTSTLADVPCKENTSNTSDSTPEQAVKVTRTVRDVKLERKIRTFKVIIVLLLTFVLCRSPYWAFFVVRLSSDMPTDTAWNVHYSFICLNLLNCALNPFLYTFLNQSISALESLKQLLGKVFSFCCCFSNSDFDEFTKYNPFVLEEDKRKKKGRGGNSAAEENPCNLACAVACVKTKKSNVF